MKTEEDAALVDFIGAGGWGYFRVPGEDSLAAYSRAFRFVEVNSTFYRHPGLRQVVDWRRRVPEDFTFSVKAHSAVTHRECLVPTAAALESFARSVAVAHALRAPVLILETPASLRFTANKVRDLTALLTSADRRALTFGLEARAHATGELPPPLERAMLDLGIVDVTDLSRQPPRIPAEVAYTRLFGKGEHNRWIFSDTELEEIAAARKRTGADRAFYTFHGVRMYKDAARFLLRETRPENASWRGPGQQVLGLVAARFSP